jgi:hypothetical protein
MSTNWQTLKQITAKVNKTGSLMKKKLDYHPKNPAGTQKDLN